MPAPAAALSPLHRADGSATYSADGYTVVGAVNGPVEVQRRDELPNEAALEVNIRPASGVGTTRERHLETILHSTLRRILLVHEFPRSLLQLTLQIVSVPGRPDSLRAASYLPILPPLLTTAVLTLLSANLPLSTTITTTLVTVSQPSTDASNQREIVTSPTPKDILNASSLHVFCFTGAGELLLSESEGEFDYNTWDKACALAEGVCLTDDEEDEDEEMEVEGDKGKLKQGAWLRKVVGEKIEKDQKWRTAARG